MDIAVAACERKKFNRRGAEYAERRRVFSGLSSANLRVLCVSAVKSLTAYSMQLSRQKWLERRMDIAVSSLRKKKN